MTDNNDLRQKAETHTLEKAFLEDIENMTQAEVKQKLHELRVHQIELEMQNEKLRTTKEALDASRARYVDLYYFAPVGYITLSEQGFILETNFTAAILLDDSRSHLVNQPISGFIFKEDQDIYYRHRKKLFEAGEPQKCELRMVKKDGSTFWARLDAIAVPDSAGAPTCRIVVSDITERKRAETRLGEEQKLISTILTTAGDPIFVKDNDHCFVIANRAFYDMLGLEEKDVIGRTLGETLPADAMQHFLAVDRQVLDTGIPDQREEVVTAKNGVKKTIIIRKTRFIDDSGKRFIVGSIHDITKIRRAEEYREMGREALQILNEPGNLQESIQRVLFALKTRTGFEAAGIRLQDGDDFPYFSQQGFSDDFLLTENTLVERDADGGVCRDKDGNVSLECTCGLVISGKTDPKNPFFTHGGSCWTNDTADTPFMDTRHHPRDRCLHDGFQSVALVPIRNKNRIVGLIQLNDRRKGLFTLDAVVAMEGIASYIGAALMRKQAEAELREKERLQGVLEMAGAICHELSQPLQIISGYSSILQMDREETDPLYKPVKGIEAAISRADMLMKKIMGITRYQSKPYLKNTIVDIEKASHHGKE